MLEEPIKYLSEVLDDLEKLDKDTVTDFDERQRFLEKTFVAFETVMKRTKNPEISIIAANMPKLLSDDMVVVAYNNLFRNLTKIFLVNITYSLEVIDRELTKIKKPVASTTEDAERIKLLEKNTANLKNQVETMKPLFARLKKDYAKRKKWLRENR